MATRTRPIDRASDRTRRALATVGGEVRSARIDRGLSLTEVGRAVGISKSQASRIERGLSPRVPVLHLARLSAAVGLELSIRTFPGGQPIRDAAQVRLLLLFRGKLHRSLGWATEVPVPIPGDQRAWDAVVSGRGWRYGVEAETATNDVQALLRRLALKQRDGLVEGVILVLPLTRRTRILLREAGDLLTSSLPVPGVRALELLQAGLDPGGSAVVVI